MVRSERREAGRTLHIETHFDLGPHVEHRPGDVGRVALQDHRLPDGASGFLHDFFADHLRKEVGRHVFTGILVIPQGEDTDIDDELLLLSKRDSDWSSNGGFADSRHRM